MNSDEHCIVDRDGGLLTVTMNRPDARNALSPEMICGLVDAWELANTDEGIRVVILTGAGGTFSAGADLKTMGRDKHGAAAALDRMSADPDLTQKALLHLRLLDKPLIAAVEGFAVGGGTEILQATDIRIAGEGARFGLPEVRWGLFPLAGSVVRLRRQIPYTKAAEMLLTGDLMSAQQAHACGLIGRVVPDGQALDEARTVGRRILDNGPLAIKAVMDVLRATEGISETEAVPIGLRIGRPVFQSSDAYEGTAAFAQKRRPNFTGA